MKITPLLGNPLQFLPKILTHVSILAVLSSVFMAALIWLMLTQTTQQKATATAESDRRPDLEIGDIISVLRSSVHEIQPGDAFQLA